MTESGPGRNIPIILLKTRSIPNDGYKEQFSEVRGKLSFEPYFVPVLEHQLLEEGLHTVRGLLSRGAIGREETCKYGGMIFTSQRAVEAFAKLVGEGEESWPQLQDIPIYTVGPASSRALQSIAQTPLQNIFGADTGNGEALAHYILNHYGQWYQDRETKSPLLFLVGEQRRDIIPKTLMDLQLPMDKRIQVDELEVYGTGVMESFERDFAELLRTTDGHDMRWVVVFSPTGCEAMFRALDMLDPATGKARPGDQLGRAKIFIASIGPTTREYLRSKFSFEPAVCAEKPSPEGIQAGIISFLDNKG